MTLKSALRLRRTLLSITLLVSACGLIRRNPDAATAPAAGETQPASSSEVLAGTAAPGAGSGTPTLSETEAGITTPTRLSTTDGVDDVGSLVGALQAAGANASLEGEIAPSFFSVGGSLVQLNGEDLQVYEFADAAALEAEASRISPDGGQIGDTSVRWIAPPHFFRTDRMIVLYIGTTPEITGLLERLLGPPFAGAGTDEGSPSPQTVQPVGTRPPESPGSTPQPQAAAPCVQENESLVPYENSTAGYCLAVPVRFQVEAIDPQNVFINGPPVGEGPEPLRATLNIAVLDGFNGQGLAEVVEGVTQEYGDLDISRTPWILGKELAVVVEGLPGRIGTRQVFALHEGRLYNLIFRPIDPDFSEVKPDVDDLWNAVMETFAFLET